MYPVAQAYNPRYLRSRRGRSCRGRGRGRGQKAKGKGKRHHKFETYMDYMVSSRPTWAT